MHIAHVPCAHPSDLIKPLPEQKNGYFPFCYGTHLLCLPVLPQDLPLINLNIKGLKFTAFIVQTKPEIIKSEMIAAKFADALLNDNTLGITT